MIKTLMALTLFAQAPTYAPFILQQEDAVYVDSNLELKNCKINKNSYSRWYWFDGIGKAGNYTIDLTTVRFVFVDDQRGEVVAMAYPPFDEVEVKTVANGTYKFVNNRTEIHCYP